MDDTPSTIWIKVPRKALRLDPAPLKLYLLLLIRANGDSRVRFFDELLASEAGYGNRRSMATVLARLEDEGFIRRVGFDEVDSRVIDLVDFDSDQRVSKLAQQLGIDTEEVARG